MVKMIVGVEGMMCGMCEAHVNDAIRQHFKVDSVKSDRNKKETDIVAEMALDENAVKEVIDATGYQVTSFKVESYEKKKGLFSRILG